MSATDFLTDANNGAMADIAAANATPAPVEAPAPVASPTPAEPAAPVATSPEATPPEAATDTTQPPVADEPAGQQKWTFNRKGQQVEITDQAQALELMRKGHDYTEKTMELADQRRAFEQSVRDTQAWLSNPANVRAILAKIDPTFGQPQQPPSTPSSPEPDDLVTQAQAQQLATAQLREAQQYATATVQQAILQAETARYTQEYKGEVDRTIHALTQEKFPILQEIEGVNKLILDDVGAIVRARVLENPADVVSIDEVKALLVENAQKRAGRLEKRLNDHAKMQVVREAKLTKQGIEPPGAAAPAPPPAKPMKLGSQALTDTVIAELQAAFDAKS